MLEKFDKNYKGERGGGQIGVYQRVIRPRGKGGG